MEKMTFNIDKDTRKLVDATQDYDIDFHNDKNNWLTARQYEDSMRQVEVHVIQGDGSPFDLTGVNPVFEGWLPDSLHRVYDSKHGVVLDPKGGIFRFDFPARAFSVAGSYKQAFFRLMKDSDSIATLEFSLDVLADKVISGIVPSDYITPFEDLYNQLQGIIDGADGSFKDKMIDFQKQFSNTITDLDGKYGDIQKLAQVMQTKLDNMAQKAEAGDIVTHGELDKFSDNLKAEAGDIVTHGEMEAFKNDVNADVQKSLTVAPEATEVFGGYVKDKDVAALNNLKNSIDKTKFNLVFMTDNHYSSLTSDPNKPTNYTLQHVANASYFDNVDAIILGGDNVDGCVRSLANLTSDTRQITYKLLLGSMNNVDKFFLLGNHDDGSLRVVDWVTQGRSYDKPIPFTEAQMKGFYHTADLLNDEHRVNDSLYFYKDYPDKKVRLIGLNSDDMPEDILNPDGSQKYDRLHHMGWRQEQLNWLANTALSNFPKGYTALIVQHTPLDGDGGSQFYNTDAIQQILGAFKAGASTTITGNTPDFGINISTTFAEQGPQKLAGCIHGHLHKEDYKQVAGVNDIGVTSSVVNPITDDITEDEDTDAFDVVTVDTETSTVSLQGFGRATDRKFDY